MARITVRLEEKLKRALEAEARQQGVRASDIIREALVAHLHAKGPQQNALELARDIGLIGCARGLPPDLSTNPKHFEGLGSGRR